MTSNDELLQSLHDHQIELEMQNEELRSAHIALEESRTRYLSLYEFAPVGYLTLTREGLIVEINLTGATLLGMERNQLINHRFSALVANKDGDRWHLFFSISFRTILNMILNWNCIVATILHLMRSLIANLLPMMKNCRPYALP